MIVPVKDDLRVHQCVRALLAQDLPTDALEVVVVDNGSSVDLSSVASDPRVVFARERRPGSYAARNTGLALAAGQVLAFTDADCVPDPRWLSVAVATLRAGAPVVAGHVEVTARDETRPHPVEAFEMVRGFPQERYVQRSGWCATANMVTTRAVMDQVGTFDDRLLSGGDAEWGKRAAAAGLRPWFAPDAVVRHPARDSYRDLYAKLLRVRLGQVQQDALAGRRARTTIHPRSLVPPLGAVRRALASGRLTTPRARVAYVAGEFFVRYAASAAIAQARRRSQAGR